MARVAPLIATLPDLPSWTAGGATALVDLSLCRYPVVAAAADDVGWQPVGAGPGTALPGGALQEGLHWLEPSSRPSPSTVGDGHPTDVDDGAYSPPIGGDAHERRGGSSGRASPAAAAQRRRVALVVWSDLSVTAKKLLAMQHSIRATPGVSCVLMNHIPGTTELCRKQPMAAHMARMHAAYPDAFDFIPASWPSYDAYSQWCRSRGVPGAACIVKPSSGCQGRGITVATRGRPSLWMLPPPSGAAGGSRASTGANNSAPGSPNAGPATLPPGAPFPSSAPSAAAVPDAMVVQRYIERPLLIDGRKFDLRCYVFVASADPWRVYFSNSGLVRLCGSAYQLPTESNEQVASMHLTNFAVNKNHVSTPPTPSNSSTATSTPPGESPSTPPPLPFAYRASAPGGCRPSCGPKQSFAFFNANLAAVCEERELVERGLMRPLAEAWGALVPHTATTAAADAPTSACCAAHHRLSAMCGERQCVLAGLPEALRAEVRRAAAATVAGVWARIHRLVLLSLWAVLPRVEEELYASTSFMRGPRTESGVRCFELFGYDVLLDEELRPWLLEVNHSPSWSVSSAEDAAVKRRVLGLTMEALAAERHGLPAASTTAAAAGGGGSGTGGAGGKRTPAANTTHRRAGTSWGGGSPLPPVPTPTTTTDAASDDSAPSSLASSTGSGGRAGSIRRQRHVLTLGRQEYHRYLLGHEEATLVHGGDFTRLFPPPPEAGIRMDAGNEDPILPTPFERRSRRAAPPAAAMAAMGRSDKGASSRERGPRLSPDPHSNGESGATAAPSPSPPSTAGSGTPPLPPTSPVPVVEDDAWLQCMDIFAAQRQSARTRRGS